jgi:hypothetical protein
VRTHRADQWSVSERALGWFGLVLVGLIGWVADHVPPTSSLVNVHRAGAH